MTKINISVSIRTPLKFRLRSKLSMHRHILPGDVREHLCVCVCVFAMISDICNQKHELKPEITWNPEVSWTFYCDSVWRAGFVANLNLATAFTCPSTDGLVLTLPSLLFDLQLQNPWSSAGFVSAVYFQLCERNPQMAHSRNERASVMLMSKRDKHAAAR